MKKLNFNLYIKVKETSTRINSELIPKMFDMRSSTSSSGKDIQMKFSLLDKYNFIVKTEDKSQKC